MPVSDLLNLSERSSARTEGNTEFGEVLQRQRIGFGTYRMAGWVLPRYLSADTAPP